VNLIYGSALQKIDKEEERKEQKKKYKSGLIRTIAIIYGLIITITIDINVLGNFEQFKGQDLGLFDNIIAGLIVSIGSDGFNQLVKFIEKAKENQEEEVMVKMTGGE